jgi:hypothetical protein
MSADYPRLHHKVEIHPLDVGDAQASWVLQSSDGKHWHIPEVYARFLRLVDGSRSKEDLQRELDSGAYPSLSGCAVDDVLQNLVYRLNISSEFEGSRQAPKRPASNLTFLLPLFSAERLRRWTRLVRPLLGRGVVIASLILGLLLHVVSWWIAGPELNRTAGAVTSSTRLTDTGTMQAISKDMKSRLTGAVVLLVLLVVMLPIHELGHVVAAHRLGASVGKIGIGLYICVPVMYVDLSPAWRLDRKSRLAIDSAGIYFQFLASCILGLIHILSHMPVFEIAALAYLSTGVLNLNPFFKLDGYWCLADLLGVPNLQANAWRSLGRVLRLTRFGKIPAGVADGRWHRVLLPAYALAQIAFSALIALVIFVPLLCPGSTVPFLHVNLNPAADLGSCPGTIANAVAHGVKVTPELVLRLLVALSAGLFLLRISRVAFRAVGQLFGFQAARPAR